jgi:hypothetical protein
MADRNVFKLVGKLVGVDGLAGLVETQIQGASRVYEDMHKVVFKDEALLKAAGKIKGSVELIGHLAKRENSDTYPLVCAVAKTKSPHSNLARMEVYCDLYEFFPATPSQKQMGRMTAICNGSYFTVMAFRGLAAKLDIRAEMGTTWDIVGRLSPREFEQNGELRDTCDLIARTAKMLKGSGLKDELAELDKAAMGFTESGPEAESDPAAEAV